MSENNTVTESFNKSVRQMTEMFQRKKNGFHSRVQVWTSVPPAITPPSLLLLRLLPPCYHAPVPDDEEPHPSKHKIALSYSLR